MNLEQALVALADHTGSEDAQIRAERVRTAARTFATVICREAEPSAERTLALRAVEEATWRATQSIVLPRQQELFR